jgi:HSP20 family protein
MASFFEKLKKGMGVEEPIEDSVEENIIEEKIVEETPKPKKTRVKEAKKMEIKMTKIEEPEEKKKEDTEETEEKTKEVERKKKEKERKEDEEEEEEDKDDDEEDNDNDGEIKVERKESTSKQEEKEKWFETEGQLAIDVYQTENELVIQSAVAGVGIEKLDIFLEKDVLTIKGARQKPYEERGDYFFQECFWGPFSREVILPAEVDPDKVLARMKDGILTIRIPKILREKKRKITVSN